MFKRILVAVGGDDPSLEPARVGARLASAVGAELALLTVRQAAWGALGEPYYTEVLLDRIGLSERVVENARRVAEEEGVAVAAAEILEGAPADRIMEFAEHGDFSLIVMGNRGRGRFASALLGSVSARVAAHSRIPVLVVPVAAAAETEAGVRETVDARS